MELNSREQVEAVLRYTILNGMAGEDISSYINQLSGDIPEYEDLMGTIAQQLEDKGIQKGIRQGIEQGIEQGIQQGIEQERLAAQKKLLETAYALLDNGVSLEVVIKSTGLSRETLEKPRH